MSGIIETPTSYQPKLVKGETNNLQRSFSLPPKHRKSNKVLALPNGNNNSSNNHSCIEENGKEIGALDNIYRPVGTWNKNRRLFQRKADIRVSCFNPDHVEVPTDMLSRLRNAEKQSYNEVIKCNETLHKPPVSYSTLTKPRSGKLRSHSNSFFKKLQGRFGTIEKNNDVALEYVVKTVEINRKSSDVLGIFIRKQKLKNADTGKNSNQSGIFISRVLCNSVAANHESIKPGVQVMAINTVDVSSLQVKVVAAIMSMLNHLILTIKTCRESKPQENSVNHLKSNGEVKISEPSQNPCLKTKDNNDNTVVGSALKTATLSSVYDNEVVNGSGLNAQPRKPVPLAVPKENNIQSKFDESLQILLEAIAGCDKQNSVVDKFNCQSDYFKNLQETSLMHNPGSFSQSEDQGYVQKSGDLLNEILSDDNISIDSKNMYTSSEKIASSPKSHGTLPIDVKNKKSPSLDEHDYDEVPLSDDESNSLSGNSCNEEINVDAFNTAKVANGFSRFVANGTGNISFTNSHNNAADQKSAKQFTSSSALYQDNLANSVPRFPVIQATEESDLSEVNKKPSITVEKKWEWLNNGKIVSEGLQKRIDIAKRSSIKDDMEDTKCYQVSPKTNKQKKYQRDDSFSESSIGSSSQSSESPADFSYTASVKNNADFKMPKKSSVKEKSHKSLLSISPTSRFPPSYSFGQKGNKIQNSPKSFEKNDKTEVNTIAMGKSTGINTVVNSHVSRSFLTPNKSILNQNSRKKNWKGKWKKFKMIGGSSENATVNELACWAADDNQDIGFKPGTGPSSQVSTQHYIQKSIGKQNSAVLNRYHLDISMAHQRRISRQLLLNNATHDPSIKALTLSQFKKYKHSPRPNPHLIDGCLVITIYGVRDLKKTLSEAHCLVQVDNATTKRIGTTMQTCRGAVSWNQCFEMNVQRSCDLHLTLYSWETRGGKKVTSYATVNMPSLLQGPHFRMGFSERLAVRLEPRGTLYIKLALEQNSASVGPLVFGADLQSIVEREKSKFGIPSLVHSCIEEVEERGMQVVGIYRLCGSAIVKKDLRRKLEEGKIETKFSPEFYPDVNVITGILKDFLRELPQPLFPPELLEAVTTVMEKNPGPTPATAPKEAFAPNPMVIAPSPPPHPGNQSSVSREGQNKRTTVLLQHIKMLSTAPAERATLFALMNHLKRVAMHHHQNKMTCQNLAVCFGPVLLGPINAGQVNGIDINAAIGFKRHIQVLNYMLSNWPDEAVILPDYINNTATKVAESDSANRMSCVSLTRRLSRVYVMEDQEENEEEKDFEKREMIRKCESLSSILESPDGFCDPKLDMYSSNGPKDFNFSEMESCDL